MVAKSFIIFLFLSLIIGYATKNWVNALVIMGVYAGAKILWNIIK
jgi:hypothetical protein